MSTYSSQPDETNGYDAYIMDDFATTNFNDGYIQVGEDPTEPNRYERGLIKFADLTTVIPAHSYVNAGTSSFTWTYNVAVPGTIYAYRLLRNWVEGSVTWNTYDGTNNWETAGAGGTLDCESDAMGTIIVAGTEKAGNSVAMVLDRNKIQGWVSGSVPNYGVRLKSSVETGDNAVVWYSSAATTSAYRPKFDVDYTVYGQSFNAVFIAG